MFPKWLSTLNVLVRFVVAGASLTGPFAVWVTVGSARFTAAGFKLRTTGRDATTNGRIWFLTIGAPGTASAVSAWFAAGIAAAAGSRFVAAGPSASANDCTLASVAVVWFSVDGRSATARLTLESS